MTTITRPCPAPGVRSAPARSTLAAASSTVLAALFLAACGGGGSTATPAPPPGPQEAPLSAAATIDTWEAYAASLVPSETAVPVLLDLIDTVPTSETALAVVLP